ncbi:hypothetical protein P7K49_006705, partial [Saguinus oedipus]
CDNVDDERPLGPMSQEDIGKEGDELPLGRAPIGAVSTPAAASPSLYPMHPEANTVIQNNGLDHRDRVQT